MNSTTANQAADNNSSIRVTADNLMRRVLRIQDPGNANEVAQGLGRAYPTETAELDEEIRGLPVAPPGSASSSYQVAGPATSMTNAELAYSQDNIRRDLDFLVGSSQLKEVQVELQGWGETIRTWMSDGASAAAQALDPNARDRVFSARRILLDYARVSRLVGAMTPGLSIAYRRFSRSLDEASGLLLVSLGETLAQVGFSGDRLMLQAPASELSARAEHAISALRNLIGTTTNGSNGSEWPWGTNAYRLLLHELESGGHGDIKVLLQENGLRAFADELINRASSVNGDGLRTLAATHGVALNRVERLILVAQRYSEEAPPLANFISALRLFVESFTGGTTTRLIAIGRPLLSASWLYSFGSLDRGKTRTLIDLIRARAAVAQLNDNVFGLQLGEGDAQAQFQLDTCLYALDLAIDLYAVGIEGRSQVTIEKRASAYGLLVWELLAQPGGIRALILNAPNVVRPGTQANLEKTLGKVIGNLSAGNYNADPTALQQPPKPLGLGKVLREALARELAQFDGSRQRLQSLADAMSPGAFLAGTIAAPVQTALDGVYKVITEPHRTPELRIPPPLETSAAKGLALLAPPVKPVIDNVTIDKAAATAVITGSGFVDLVAVLFKDGRTRTAQMCVVTGSAKSTQITVDLPGKPAGKGKWELKVATETGAATMSRTY